MQQIVFFIIEMLVAVAIFAIDRKRIRDYILLSLFTLVCAYILETGSTFLGFGIIITMPQIPIISLYTWLAYIPYISICYFLGK